jgi:hypothetical protein
MEGGASRQWVDRFAASQIKSHSLVDTFDLRMALEDIVWNMNAWHSLQYFGSDATFVPAVYWDEGYSHPNLEFRMLIIADLVESNQLSHQMLQAFVDARNRKPWNKVLRSINSLDEIVKIAQAMDYVVKAEKLPDRTRLHFEYTPTRATFMVDAFPGKEDAAIKEVSDAIGLNY